MRFITLAGLLVTGSATAFAAALPKANEYQSTDCSGDINFGHSASNLAVVNMDPSSHSVYLAGATWSGYSGASANPSGSGCQGQDLGPLPGACVNLDTYFADSRIFCVST
ncbi:hypothetical protein BDR22DRAFT_825553 [Usnea florida]